MANPPNNPPAPPPQDPVAQTLALLQPWIAYVPPQQRRLGVFIALALCLQLAAFYFIRIDSSRAELRRQTRTHVTVEYPKALAVTAAPADDLWDRLTDPRLYLLPRNPTADLASDAPLMDLNSTLGSNQLPPPAPAEDYHAARPAATPLDQRVAEDMRPPRQPFAYAETPPAVATKTTWIRDATLAALQPIGAPVLPSPVSDTDLSPTVLRVAIGPEGTVQHVLVERSAGELGAAAKDLDTQAAVAARKVRFQPTGQPLTWGRATVFWRYTAKPREEVVPTPPAPQ